MYWVRKVGFEIVQAAPILLLTSPQLTVLSVRKNLKSETLGKFINHLLFSCLWEGVALVAQTN